jgi:hypothetical protein
MNQPPNSPDLAPSDFFTNKIHLSGQKFQTDDELNNGSLNWLHSQKSTFYGCWHQ